MSVKDLKISMRKYQIWCLMNKLTLYCRLLWVVKDSSLSRKIKEDVRDATILEHWNFHAGAIKWNIALKNAWKKTNTITLVFALMLRKWNSTKKLIWLCHLRIVMVLLVWIIWAIHASWTAAYNVYRIPFHSLDISYKDIFSQKSIKWILLERKASL